jgi:threonine dehydrogenase-like Zn-dependent dehydrogenase
LHEDLCQISAAEPFAGIFKFDMKKQELKPVRSNKSRIAQLMGAKDGIQAEYVRIPQADGSLYDLPEDGDEEAMVMLCDILPTGYECGVLNGQACDPSLRDERHHEGV